MSLQWNSRTWVISRRRAFHATVLFLIAAFARENPGGEVQYLESFDTKPYLWVTLTQPAGYVDWPNGSLTATATNSAVRLWSVFPAFSADTPFPSLKSICLSRDGEIRTNRELVLSADIARVIGAGAYAALGWQQNALYDRGYLLLKGPEEIGLVKILFGKKIFAPLFWEQIPALNRSVTLQLRFNVSGPELQIQARALDPASGGEVLFDRTAFDTPNIDPTTIAPAPLQSAADPGMAWQGSGRLTLGIFGANAASGRLEIEADNFGMRQEREVSENDFLPLVYNHTGTRKISYRLFTPVSIEEGKRYPLVLYLHGAEGAGQENLKQFSHPGALVFADPAHQAQNPSFIAAPQFTVAEYGAAAIPWSPIADKTLGLVTNLISSHPIDPDRVYLAGISLGAAGAWEYLTSARGGLFGGAITMAGFGDPTLLGRIIDLPVWIFQGSLDQTIPPEVGFGPWRGSRTLTTELRRLGGCPVYTEYALAGHDIFDTAFEHPDLVDWLMAQRRGVPFKGAPWIQVADPPAVARWDTSYTNVTLVGSVQSERGVTNVACRNLSRNITIAAEGTTEWRSGEIPLRLGLTSGGITAGTNTISIVATAPSRSIYYEGATTFNATFQAFHIPIRISALRQGGETSLRWTGAAPAFILQSKPDLNGNSWADLVTTSETNHVVSQPASPEFYRVTLP